ncbi:LodA/GoxA family CTQ-dependent oxidase [Massilia sp. W12]|uniref:LodA/GoxA family CTQ-dependent oxidase n=1 Tax=Massilia sp. W12 TaxID=3126507 RepID=UPI0030D5B74E
MTQYKIFPAIGVARVGNAPAKFYIGPEVYRGLPTNPDGSPFTEADLRDENGKLCRQAAQFTIYAVDDAGNQSEVTLDSSNIKSITWEVHLANKKASWYIFQTSLGENGYASNHALRNAAEVNRNQLMIDAGPRNISGRQQSGVQFNAASAPAGYAGLNFPPAPLYPAEPDIVACQTVPPGQQKAITTLGELQTDGAGRLWVLGGFGISGSADPNATIGEYANNDGWWDDTSDGPVCATIEFADGSTVQAAAATVMVGPPSYAPQIPNLVTLYDTIFDGAVRAGAYPAIYQSGFWHAGQQGYWPDFDGEIKPLLERGILYPWVAAIPPKPHKFDFEMLGKTVTLPNGVVQGDPALAGLRQYILDFLRPPNAENEIVNNLKDAGATGPRAGVGATMMPYLAGDNALILGHAPAKYLRLTDTQYFFLQQWARGFFTRNSAVSQPGDAITRGVLENCVGGAFSPGIEMTWISRNPAIYQEPFRIRHQFVAVGPLGMGFDPAIGLQPGDVTRYMAVPWQADFNECSSQPIDGRILWWWPAQRPEYVYLDPQASVKAGPDADADVPNPPSLGTGMQVPWLGTDFDQMASTYIMFADDVDMVRYWAGLGFVLERGEGEQQRFVEVERALPRPFSPS